MSDISKLSKADAMLRGGRALSTLVSDNQPPRVPPEHRPYPIPPFVAYDDFRDDIFREPPNKLTLDPEFDRMLPTEQPRTQRWHREQAKEREQRLRRMRFR
ncbi:MAG TPA: hypothetical protein VNK52_14300 [Hyphomicrobiaceae bacterium]|nr:hypothetical protein [Hyphomicrobiaceae bacterium]